MNDAETAYAKLNLALHVRRRRPDGYHDIETIFAFANVGDVLTAAPAEKLSLTVTGPFAANLGGGEDNLVLRAARVLAEGLSGRGAALTLDKQLPVASGIGGGSADAAAALRLLNRVWRTGRSDAQLAAIGQAIGADVPACVYSRTARGEGAGETLRFLDARRLRGLGVLLVNPGRAVGTARVFAGWDGIDRGALSEGDPFVSVHSGRNDLEPAATVICPEISEVLAVLRREDAMLVRMSGSGATCFALFADIAAAERAATRLGAADGRWWTTAAKLL